MGPPRDPDLLYSTMPMLAESLEGLKLEDEAVFFLLSPFNMKFCLFSRHAMQDFSVVVCKNPPQSFPPSFLSRQGGRNVQGEQWWRRTKRREAEQISESSYEMLMSKYFTAVLF